MKTKNVIVAILALAAWNAWSGTLETVLFWSKIFTILQCNAKEAKTMPKKTKANLEFLLVKAEVKGVPERGA